jgi:hypothetical protein
VMLEKLNIPKEMLLSDLHPKVIWQDFLFQVCWHHPAMFCLINPRSILKKMFILTICLTLILSTYLVLLLCFFPKTFKQISKKWTKIEINCFFRSLLVFSSKLSCT